MLALILEFWMKFCVHDVNTSRKAISLVVVATFNPSFQLFFVLYYTTFYWSIAVAFSKENH